MEYKKRNGRLGVGAKLGSEANKARIQEHKNI